MADNTTISEISIDKYDLEKNWFERIAPKYLNVENLNHLKVGLYGYINEVMATSIRYATAHRNFLYDEAFLNTASLTKSIYNKAKSYNYEIPMAKPASMNITFTITQRDIIKYGTKNIEGSSYSYTFTLSADDKYFCNKIQFMAEDDIIIKATKLVDGTYSYIAQYDRSKSKDNKGIFSSSTNPYIPIWVTRSTITNDTDVITFQYKIYQVSKTIKTFENYSSDLSDNLYFEQEFTSNLANFTVKYRTPIVDTYLNPYFNDTFTPDDPYYCYYNFSNTMLTIFFSGLAGNFKPVINSKLYLSMYTTLGAAGNFTYNGEVTHQFNNASLNRNITDKAIAKLDNPSGGTNMPTRGEVKQALIYEFLTRNNLITEFDLNTYFNNIVNEQILNASKMLFIKKRDDLIVRSYVGYALLRDQTGLIIPTNTINLSLPYYNVNEEFHIPSGSLVKFVSDSNDKDITKGKYYLTNDEIVLNNDELKYYDAVPTYFRNDDYIFVEVRDKVANYLDENKNYVLYKDKDTKITSYIRYRNHYLEDIGNSPIVSYDSNSGISSVAGYPIKPIEDNIAWLRITNEMAEKLESSIYKKATEVEGNIDNENFLFITYTFDSTRKFTNYNPESNESEYIRLETAITAGYYDLNVTQNPEQFKQVDSSKLAQYVKVDKFDNREFRKELGMTENNCLHIVQKEDGYFYLPIDITNPDARLMNLELADLYKYTYYEAEDMRFVYNTKLKEFLDSNNYNERLVYNFSNTGDKDFVISEILDESLDASYLYKKMYVWLKDENFKNLIDSLDEEATKETYISYDYQPPRVFVKYKESFDKNYFDKTNLDRFSNVCFRDLEETFFTTKTTNCIKMKEKSFLEYKSIVASGDFTEEELYEMNKYTFNDEYFVLYDSTDSRMRKLAGYKNENLKFHIPYILPKYIKLTSYVENLKKDKLIDYSDDSIITIDNVKYIPYLAGYERYETPEGVENVYVFYNGNGYLDSDDCYTLVSNSYNDTDTVYRIPYALHYKPGSSPKMLAIQNTLNKNLYFNFKEVNGNISSEFLIDNINIERSAITYDRLVSDEITDNEDGISTRTTKMTNGFVESTVIMKYDSETGNLLDEYAEIIDGDLVAKPMYTYKINNDINKYVLSFKLNTTLFANLRTTMEDIRSNELTRSKHYYFNNDREYYDYCKQQKVLIVRCLLRDTDNGDYIGYFDFENEDFSNLEYTYVLETDNKLNSQNELHLINCIRSLKGDNIGELVDDVRSYIPERVTLELCFLVRVLKDKNDKPYYSDTLALTEPLDVINEATKKIDGYDYSCAIRMESNTPFYFYKIVSDVINPVLDISSNSNEIAIKDLPVVGKHYLYNYNVFKDFFNTFGLYYDLLKDSFDKLENNTDINLKFYNTYGPSHYFHNNKSDNCITTDINMKLSIKLIDTYTQDLDFKIKNFILEFVENINETNKNTFAISNLIRELEKNFDDIDYIEFEELNGQELKSNGNQIILNNCPSILDMDRQQLINYVPEYLNVHINKEAYIQGADNFQVGIDITYK